MGEQEFNAMTSKDISEPTGFSTKGIEGHQNVQNSLLNRSLQRQFLTHQNQANYLSKDSHAVTNFSKNLEEPNFIGAMGDNSQFLSKGAVAGL